MPPPSAVWNGCRASRRGSHGSCRTCSRVPGSGPAARACWRWTGRSRPLPSSMRGHRSGPATSAGVRASYAYHPTSPNIIFAAGVSGGIWKTDDNAITWRPIADGLANIAVNALVIDPREPDVMFAGTGEGYFREEIRGTGLPLRGGGIFVTRDGGRSWQRCARHRPSRLLLGQRSRAWASATAASSTRPRAPASGDRAIAARRWTRLIAADVRGGCLDLAIRRPIAATTCSSHRAGRTSRRQSIGFCRADKWRARRRGAARAGHGPHVARDRAVEPRRHLRAWRPATIRGPQGTYRQGAACRVSLDSRRRRGTWETRVTNTDPDAPQHAAAHQPVERHRPGLQHRSQTPQRATRTWVGT